VEELGSKRIKYIDGTPVAYHQTDIEGDVGPVVIEGAVAEQGYIQWPDGTGVSLQLHHPNGWDPRGGGGSAYSFYLDLQNLLHLALLGADMGELWDYAHDLAQEEVEQE
jgi:hypothetical protein